VHTGAVSSLEAHPFPLFQELGFRVTLNTDNRLMSSTSMTQEYLIAVEQFGCTFDDLETLTINGMKSAFAHYGERCRLIYDRIKRPFAALRAELGLPPRRAYGDAQS
jgi:adenosine deaminase